MGRKRLLPFLVTIAILASACGAPIAPQTRPPPTIDANADVSSGQPPAKPDLSACPEKCSGHDAGHAWAESQNIQSNIECRGDDPTFLEGCEDYARHHGEKMEYEREQIKPP
jgi:hypothetical protein